MSRAQFGRPGTIAGAAFALLFALFGPSIWADSQDLETNPATHHVEAVEVSASHGSRVRHVDDSGQSGDQIETLVSSGPAVSCRIAIKPSGESWAVWQDAATSEIRYAVRDPLRRVWAPERRISNPGEIGSNPRIVHTESSTVFAYEVVDGPDSSITVSIISDTPEPIPLSATVGTTSYDGDRDLDLRSEGGHVWLNWRSGVATLDWSEYDPQTGRWSVPTPVSINGQGAGAARAAIRAAVLQN